MKSKIFKITVLAAGLAGLIILLRVFLSASSEDFYSDGKPERYPNPLVSYNQTMYPGYRAFSLRADELSPDGLSVASGLTTRRQDCVNMQGFWPSSRIEFDYRSDLSGQFLSRKESGAFVGVIESPAFALPYTGMTDAASYCSSGEAGCLWQRLTEEVILDEGTTIVFLPVLADGTEYSLRYSFTHKAYDRDGKPPRNMNFADADSQTSGLALSLMNDDSAAYPNTLAAIDSKSLEIAQFLELPPEPSDVPLTSRYRDEQEMMELYASGRLKAVLVTSPKAQGNVVLALGISYKPSTSAALAISPASQQASSPSGRIFIRRIKEASEGRISYVFPPLGQIATTMVGTSGAGLSCREKIWLASRAINLLPSEVAGFSEVVFLVPESADIPEMRYGPLNNLLRQ